MKTKHIPFLIGLFTLTAIISFGLQDCSKKENFDPMEIVGEWEITSVFDRSGRNDLSICSKEDLIELANTDDWGIYKLISIKKDKTGAKTEGRRKFEFTWFYHDQEMERKSYMVRYKDERQLNEKLQLAYKDDKLDQLKKHKSYKLLYYPDNLPAPRTTEDVANETLKNSKLNAECLQRLRNSALVHIIFEYSKK